MNRIALVCLLLFAIASSKGLYAQDNLKEGYILTLKGDTVKGFIDVKDWGMNPEKVHFKSSPSDDGAFYGPYDIKEFGMGTDIFEGGFVDVEVSSREQSNLNYNADLLLEKNLVFLQTLIKGPKSLYVYGRAVYDQFYIKTDSTFELLAYKKFLKDVKSQGQSTNTVVVENKRYVGQLIIYLEDCPGIKSVLSSTQYNQEGLEKVFREYYKCKGTNFKKIKAKRNISFKFGGTTGLNLSSLDFNYFRQNPIEPAHFKAVPIGISLEIGRPLSLPRWSLYNDFCVVTPYSLDYYKMHTESSGQVWSEISLFSFTGFKFVNMVRYSLLKGRYTFFANIGISNELIRGSWDTYTTTTILATTTKQHYFNDQKYSVMKAAVGAGVRLSRFSLEVRVEPANKEKMAGTATNILLNYRFSK